MATVLDGAIVPALKEIGVLGAGDTPTAEDAADALAALNRLVNQLGAERLTIYTITRATWAITSGTYTVAGTATQPRPGHIDHVSYVDATPTPDLEIGLTPITDAGWAALATKDLTAPRPTSWYYEPTFPDGILTLYPAPTDAGLTGVLYVPQAVAQFAALTDAISLPPGYSELLVTHLAIRLATPYGRQVDPSLRERAVDAKAIVKRSNVKLHDISFPSDALIGTSGGYYDIRTG